jgi:hypothetical protein
LEILRKSSTFDSDNKSALAGTSCTDWTVHALWPFQQKIGPFQMKMELEKSGKSHTKKIFILQRSPFRVGSSSNIVTGLKATGADRVIWYALITDLHHMLNSLVWDGYLKSDLSSSPR